MTANAELESLRKVHRTLMEAIKAAETAVNAQLAQRRFWLEEICSNLDEEGNIQTTSIWKRPMPVKMSTTKRSSVKAISLKRKKNSLESSETKPAKKTRKKKKDDEKTEPTTKPQPKKGPTVKIKMRTIPVPSERLALSPDSEDTESQKDDDGDSTAGSYQVAHPSDHNSDWETAANNPLEMMAAVAFGANPASYPPEVRDVQEHQPMIASTAQHRHYAPHGVRTYTSLEDVGASDDDSDEDIF